MRIVGYIREAPGPDNGESAYAQSERIRRWAARAGHSLMAVCQDVQQAGDPGDRTGYRALLGILDSGEADVVVLPDLATLSADKIVQEVMLWDLRLRGISVLTTEEGDLPALSEPPPDPARLLVRDALARVTEYGSDYASSPEVERPAGHEVVVELVPHERAS